MVLRTVVHGSVLISGFRRRQPEQVTLVTHRPSSRLPLLSTRTAVTFPASERHRPRSVPVCADWWTDAWLVSTLTQYCWTVPTDRQWVAGCWTRHTLQPNLCLCKSDKASVRL